VCESRAMRSSGRGRGCAHDLRKAAFLHAPTAPLSKSDGVAPRVDSQRFVGASILALDVSAPLRRKLLAGETRALRRATKKDPPDGGSWYAVSEGSFVEAA
jgi:hypothetical protein